MTHPQLNRTARRRMRGFAVAGLCGVLAACSHNKQPDTDFDQRPDPIPVHVKNENFLDMNIAVVANGTSRRLGMVPGNGSGDFTVNWSVANGSGLYLTAIPIGGSGSARSATLNVSPGQVIEFKIGSVLRQSVAIVHDP